MRASGISDRNLDSNPETSVNCKKVPRHLCLTSLCIYGWNQSMYAARQSDLIIAKLKRESLYEIFQFHGGLVQGHQAIP
jgi:hypothetical protein